MIILAVLLWKQQTHSIAVFPEPRHSDSARQTKKKILKYESHTEMRALFKVQSRGVRKIEREGEEEKRGGRVLEEKKRIR